MTPVLPAPPTIPACPTPTSYPPTEASRRSLFDRSYLDALDAARPDRDPSEGSGPTADRPTAREDEEHFVPPEPPPVPRGTPARRLAWAGLFLPPLLMLAAVVFGWTFAPWFSLAAGRRLRGRLRLPGRHDAARRRGRLGATARLCNVRRARPA